MTFDRRDLRTIYAALNAGIEWESSLADSYAHMQKDPQYGKSLRTAKKYEKLRLKIGQALSLKGKAKK